jgi:hypothetical protein
LSPERDLAQRKIAGHRLFADYTGYKVLEAWASFRGAKLRMTPGAVSFFRENVKFLSGSPEIQLSAASQAWYLVERLCLVEDSHGRLACQNASHGAAPKCAGRVPAPLP